MNETEIFIYCGGKCGSSTLEKTFKDNNFKTEKIHSNNEFKYTRKINKDVYDVINECRKKRIIYIIDVYRTPIERKISSFFENIDKHLPNYKKMSIDELINIFNKDYLNILEEYHPINEIMDKFKHPRIIKYNSNKKYMAIFRDNIFYLKLRFCDIKEWDTILSIVFNKSIKISSNNNTETKEIFKLYTDFKEKYKVPRNYLDNMIINDKEFNIYNTIDEQQQYYSKWLKKSI